MQWHPIKDWSSREFFELAEIFGDRCADAFPGAVLVVAKWRPEDLIPGLSDLDTRIICREMTPQRWLDFEMRAAQIQLDLMRERPEWARKLEHTPGTCLSVEELVDNALYESEMHTWSYYWGDSDLYRQFRDYLTRKPWGHRDEHYHLKRWLMFWGPYNREADPIINVAQPIIPRYWLHSRCLHYFVPALQAALGLIRRQPVPGKRETLYRWLEICPGEPVLHEVAEAIERQYAVSYLDDSAVLAAFDARLQAFLCSLAPQVLDAVTLVDLGTERTMEHLKARLKGYPEDPLQIIFHAVRVFRIRRGRYYCYLHAPAHFETDLMIPREVTLLRGYAVEGLWKAYARLRWDTRDLPVDEILERLSSDFLAPDELRVAREIRRGFSTAMALQEAKEFMAWAQDAFPIYYLVLERVFADARRLLSTRPAAQDFNRGHQAHAGTHPVPAA